MNEVAGQAAAATRDPQKLLTDVIKKQIVILGPDITLAKARNVPGLSIADDGSVLSIQGDPQIVTQKLIEQFMELSGLIVKKTMEPLLSSFPGGVAATAVMNPPQPALNTQPATTPPTQQNQTQQPATTPNPTNTNNQT